MAILFLLVLLFPAAVVKADGTNSVCDHWTGVCKCKKGFEPISPPSELHCKDINECKSTNQCVGDCKNTDGSYECTCDPKFTGDGRKDGTGCSDRDECAESPNRCGGGTCVNIKANKTTINGFKCDCGPGHVTFRDIACSEQTCKFDIPSLPPKGQIGTCVDLYNIETDKIQLSYSTAPGCHIGCRAGYKRIGGTYTCGANNPDGAKTANTIGVIAHTPLECVEQKCNLITDGNLASFGKYATLGSCGGVYMDALAGKRTCELECMTGFVKTAGGVISCGPNGDEPWGKLSGSIVCQGIPCGPLVVPNSDHKDGHNKNSKTFDEVSVTCDDGYVDKNNNGNLGATAACIPGDNDKSLWVNLPNCQELRCPLKKIPNSDRADGITARVNEKVTVKCDGATDLFAIVCIAIRPGVAMWQGSASCPAVTCPPLDVDNGKASSTSPSKVTETVDIACDDGYKKVGTSATCSPAGLGKAAWTNIPKCEAVSCPPKKIPNSDKANGITGKVGKGVAVTCNGATNAFAVSCTAVGPETAVWSGLVSCPETPADMCAPLIVAHGKASSTSPSKVTETVDIVCDDGYEKTGSKAVCSSTGSGQVAWTNIPTCEAASCPIRKIPNSDKEDGITGKVGETASVKCHSAAEPFAVKCVGVGPGKAHWTGFAPCADTPADMCAPLNVANGKASSTAYTKIRGTATITCNDGSVKNPMCVPGASGQAEWDEIPECQGMSLSFYVKDDATFAALSAYLWTLLLLL